MPFLNGPDLRTNYQILGPALQGASLQGANLRDETPPVAMIHGLGANLAFWYLGAAPHLAKTLAQSHGLLMHDMRGHGASSMPPEGYDLTHLAADFGALLDALGIARVHLVGHSHGARVALAYALIHPERVVSLTLADTQLRALQEPMRLRDWPHWPRWKADLAAQGVSSFPSDEAEIDFRVLAALGPRGGQRSGPLGGQRRAGPPRVMGAQIGAQIGLPGGGPVAARLRAAREQGQLPPGAATPVATPTITAAITPAITAAITAAITRDGTNDGTGNGAMDGAGVPGRIDLRSRQMGVRSSQQWEKLLTRTSAATDLDSEAPITMAGLAALRVPVLLMYGAVSHCVPTSDRLLEILPDARRILVPEAGHFFPLVKPRGFARALRMFVARVESGLESNSGSSLDNNLDNNGGRDGPSGRPRLMARMVAARRRQGGGV